MSDSSGGPVYHYTKGPWLFAIIADGLIKPATAFIPKGERPAVWFTARDRWEPTASIGFAGGFAPLPVQVEMMGALVRFSVVPSVARLRWPDYLRQSGIDLRMADHLAAKARELGSDLNEWRLSFHPVSVRHVLAIETSVDGEVWERVSEFLETKNGRSRRLPISPAIRAVLAQCPAGKASGPVFLNSRTQEAYTVNGVAHVFRRALTRAGITSGDVTLHTLRHTALSRMIASGIDAFTVMAISGHSSTRMLERYTHPEVARKLDAFESFAADGQKVGRTENQESKNYGGRREDRTRDLRVAKANGVAS